MIVKFIIEELIRGEKLLKRNCREFIFLIESKFGEQRERERDSILSASEFWNS